MRIWAVAVVVAGMAGGCKFGPYRFACTDDASCGVGGKCEPGFNLCSFANASCPSGRSFGDLGGSNSGECVGGQLPPDAGPDGPPPDGLSADARVCFGAAPFTVCFMTPPSGTIDVSLPTTFSTDTGTVTGTQLTCASPTSGGTGYCVVAADTITIGASLRAVGVKPLVLVAATSISVPGSIDVGSHRVPVESIGAGAEPVTGCNSGTPPGTGGGTSGGGAGGSFMGAGGNGGNGANIGGVAGTRGTPVVGAVTVIRGGCPGQDGAGTGKGARGHGGGAVFLIAGNTVTVDGTISAGGEGGAGGTATASGGAGGGAGGMIGFDATTIRVPGIVGANGGGGGEGSSNNSGNNGNDATSTTAAVGGANGSGPGGNGGDGSSGAASGPGVAAQDGASGGGGGGGGGGAGLIKGPPASLGGNVSPVPSP